MSEMKKEEKPKEGIKNVDAFALIKAIAIAQEEREGKRNRKWNQKTSGP